jgi:hypothetical protein
MQRRIGRTVVSCCLAAGAFAGGCATGGGVRLAPLAPPRIVAAHRASGNAVHIRMSDDGLMWTEGAPVINNGFTMTTFVEPAIFYESGLYHLYWLDAAGVRYATSRDAEQWLVQGTAMTQLGTGLEPVFARGNGHSFAFWSSANGIQQIDLDNPLTRTTIPVRTSARPSAAYGSGRFVVAGIDASRHPVVVTSTDGRQWSSPVSINLTGAYLANVSFSGGRYRLAAKRQRPSADPDVPGVACNVFDSADAAVWTELQPPPPCGNVPSEPTPFLHGGVNLVVFNYDNRLVSVSVNGGRPQDTHFQLPLGRISMTVGPGPMLAAFHLDHSTVVAGVRQDMTIASLGYHVRVGQPGSARVAYLGQLIEFASDRNVDEGSDIPQVVSPPAWIVHQAVDLQQPTGRLDVMGGVQIAIDRGACPEGPIKDKLFEARAALENAMNRHLASASTKDLLDDTKRDAVTALIRCEVQRTIEGGNPATCTPGPTSGAQSVLDALASVFSAAANAIGDFFTSAVTEVACGFNQDQQLDPADILIVGTQFFGEANSPRTAYRIDPGTPSRPLDPFTVRTADGSKNWSIRSTLRFLGVP